MNRSGVRGVLLAAAVLLTPPGDAQAGLEVRYAEGLVRGFLVLRATDGTLLADGDLEQVPRGSRVTSHLVFRFKDGSRYDETVDFSQQGAFRLLNYHLVQKGPA